MAYQLSTHIKFYKIKQRDSLMRIRNFFNYCQLIIKHSDLNTPTFFRLYEIIMTMIIIFLETIAKRNDNLAKRQRYLCLFDNVTVFYYYRI